MSPATALAAITRTSRKDYAMTTNTQHERTAGQDAASADRSPADIATAVAVLAWHLTGQGAGGTYSMTCDEVEALAAVLAVAGHHLAAAQVLQTHAIGDGDPEDRHAHLHPSLDDAEIDARILAACLAEGVAASAVGAWYDRANRCRACGEHLSNPHALGCPGDLA